MKKKKNNELKNGRDQALYSIYLEGLRQGRFTSMREACRYISEQPAPQFFIEAKKASILVGRIISGSSINLNLNSRKRVWEIYRRYSLYLTEHPDCKISRQRILEEIVMEPAPQFYLEPQRIRKILYKEMKKVRQKWMQQE